MSRHKLLYDVQTMKYYGHIPPDKIIVMDKVDTEKELMVIIAGSRQERVVIYEVSITQQESVTFTVVLNVEEERGLQLLSWILPPQPFQYKNIHNGQQVSTFYKEGTQHTIEPPKNLPIRRNRAELNQNCHPFAAVLQMVAGAVMNVNHPVCVSGGMTTKPRPFISASYMLCDKNQITVRLGYRDTLTVDVGNSENFKEPRLWLNIWHVWAPMCPGKHPTNVVIEVPRLADTFTRDKILENLMPYVQLDGNKKWDEWGPHDFIKAPLRSPWPGYNILKNSVGRHKEKPLQQYLYEYAKNENALEINWKDQPWSDVQSNARKSYWYNY